MCLYPKLIKNKKYQKNKKNGGIIPAVSDKRTLLVPVGCGKCMECRKQKARQWQVRLHEEIRENKNGKFVTLTFSNESIKELSKEIELKGYDLDNEIATIATRRFLERWRKKYKKSVKHWLITEIGGNRTERIHIHGIIWTDETKEIINKIWKYGNTWIGDKTTGGYVNERTVNYIVKYVTKIDEKHKEYTSKVLTSPRIGKKYIERSDSKKNKYKENETNEIYKTKTGIKLNLPIYYRNKIYTEEEREKLWIEKLDKKEIWVCGEKINIGTKEGEEQYLKTLEYYRKKNNRLGYGDDKKNWELKKYENQIRNQKHIEQMNKKKKDIIIWEEPKEEEVIIKQIEYNNLKDIF